ncbi:MAG: Unknown protein [uncultured Sulfurovum sp.]|uniref:ATPase AAA-type core domain-containing protein n=1 Tax=uncultured Sulfurovum sp. TaxID=269237 RepID=A0A6S6RZ65_9BACT|nr:MAG: Unknown protein [uncultured Sulfurovum sp.]
MIEKIHIQNFKSIYDLELEVGRVNLFIGENGSGKSNLLEALVFVSASESNMLANEFLVSRGLRVPEPELMRSAFEEKNKDKNILIKTSFSKNKNLNYEFQHDNMAYSQWRVLDQNRNIEVDLNIDNETLDFLKNNKYFSSTETLDERLYKVFKLGEDTLSKQLGLKILQYLNNFIIYSPENTALRIFEKEGQIQPLGINGEGLLKLLKIVNNYENKSYINTIIESLKLFNWFEDITIPTDISSQEDKVIIKDKYLYREFTQRSANEGFLFILFYITLIVAKETPKAFAIDNIDASLNPKLCTKLMKILTELAHKYDKQIFLTTHNPAILDGIDLNDEEQKLFVVSRNKKGHTRMKEITVENKPKSSDDEPLHLSEAFIRGYLGGLPKGF